MPVIRKLVAVVIADVVGYSRLMERDESGTHERLQRLRDELIDPKIAEHGGRTVKTTGDGMLLEFPSATSALRCAVEIQREMGVRNLYVAPDDRIQYRVGINLGDIIVEGMDIIGDGVNVAARLETLAEPGGISVASAIWEQVHEDLGIEFIDSGEQHVKNISKPIRVFRVALGKGPARRVDASPGTATTASSSRRTHRGVAISAGALALFVLIAIGAWMWMQRERSEAIAGAAEPSRSILVLPFTAPTSDPEALALADSLTADVARMLADTARDLRVVAPSVAEKYKGKPIDERQIGREVNVRYLLEGEVRPVGDNVVVTARLVDAAAVKQLGSERQLQSRARIAQDEEQLTGRLTFATRDMLDTAERRRAAAAPPTNATPHDLVNRAGLLTQDQDLRSLHEARKLYDEAIRRDPSLAAAWSGRALMAFDEYLTDFTADNARLVAEMERDSQRAIALDAQDPLAWFARGMALSAQSRHEAAFDATNKARALDPTRFFILLGYLYVYSGRAEEALKVDEARTAALGKTDPALRTMVCHAQLMLGNYRQAIAECERGTLGNNGYWGYMNLAAAYAMAGDMAQAAAAKAEVMRIVPEFTIARFEAKRFSNNPKWIEEAKAHLISGLRKAGFPE